MTMISKAAFAALLLAGAGTLATPPAAAKDKQDKQQPQMKLSDAFRKAAAPAERDHSRRCVALAAELPAQTHGGGFVRRA